MTRSEQCKRCAWWRRVAGFNYADFGCAYADSSKGRKTVTKTVCDLHGIPYKEAARRVPEILEREGCPCYTRKEEEKEGTVDAGQERILCE